MDGNVGGSEEVEDVPIFHSLIRYSCPLELENSCFCCVAASVQHLGQVWSDGCGNGHPRLIPDFGGTGVCLFA